MDITNKQSEICFSDGRRIPVLEMPLPGTFPERLQAKALVLFLGDLNSTETSDEDPLKRLLSQKFVQTLNEAGAAIIDRAGQVSLARLLGSNVKHRKHRPPLVCIADRERLADQPSRDSDLDSEHDLFVVAAESGERESQLVLAEAAVEATPNLPVIALLLGGGEADKPGLLRVVRRGWPVISVTGSGGLADELDRLRCNQPKAIDDPLLAEVIGDGHLSRCALDNEPEDLEHILLTLLNPNDTLRRAWATYSLYDLNALHHQKLFYRLQNAILFLGVLATLLALSQASLFTNKAHEPLWLYQIFHYTIVVIPITMTALMAAVNNFKSGQKYIELRGSAEAVKREIYHYRTRTGQFPPKVGDRAQSILAARLKKIGEHLMNTNTSESSLQPYEGPVPPIMYGPAADDDGLSILSPDSYVTVRLGDQSIYYQTKSNKLEKQVRRHQWTISIMGGLGTLMAAVGLDLWIPLTTAILASVITFMEYRQTAVTLSKFTVAGRDLTHVEDWWKALPVRARAKRKSLEFLVDMTEGILARELSDWINQMQDAIAKLKADQDQEPIES